MVGELVEWRAAADLQRDEDVARSKTERDPGSGAGGGEVGAGDRLLYQGAPHE